MVPSGAAPPKLDNGFNPSDFAESNNFRRVMAPVANSWLPLSQNSLAPGVFASRQVPNDPNGDPAKLGQGRPRVVGEPTPIHWPCELPQVRHCRGQVIRHPVEAEVCLVP